MTTERYLAWLHSGNGNGFYAALLVAVLLLLLGAPLLVIAGGAVGGFALGKGIGLVLLGSSGRAAQTIYAPATAGRYARTHSNIDAMEAKGDFRGAAAAWEDVARSEPANPWPLLRSGELFLRELHEPATALDRFRRAREAAGITPEQHLYVSQKMIDLYLGPLGDEGRALVELRRLIDRHPGTREADGARAALQRLKAGPRDAAG